MSSDPVPSSAQAGLALARGSLRDVMLETREYGFEKVRAEQIELGAKVRALLESRGFPSVAAEGWKAPALSQAS